MEKIKTVLERIRKGLSTKPARIVLIGIIVVCIGVIIYDATRKKEKEEIVEEVRDEVIEVEETDETVISVDFDKLHQINPDIYAWIMVPGTNVNYPVLQSPEDKDTDYYLETNLDGSSGLPGCIYTQLRNSKDFSDPDTVLYGHDMKNGTMFKTLHNYEDKEFFDANKYIYIYTPDDVFVYQIFAAISYDDRLILDYYSDFTDAAVFEEYLSEISEQPGNIDETVEVDSNDRIITLSTCIATASDRRFLVIGKLLDDDEVKALGEDALKDADENAGNAQEELTGDSADDTEDTENTESTESTEGED